MSAERYDPVIAICRAELEAERENAVTPAYEGEVERPCTCTLACQPAVELVDEYMYCREQRDAENDVPGAFGPGFVFNPAVFGKGG